MGPIILFDKSALQSFSVDEAVLFDNFFLSNICPIFFVETLADLEKAVRAGRTPEEEVGLIAAKTPVMHSYPNMFHRDLCVSNLLGYSVTIDGRPLIAGGNPVKTKNQSGVVFEETPEARAFSRWQDGKFLEVEREAAKIWRDIVSNLNFDVIAKSFQALGINPNTCRSLNEAKAIAESIVNKSAQSQGRMKNLFLPLLGISNDLADNVLKRWRYYGSPSLSIYAPYAAYVLTVDIFFYIAVAAKLIAPEKVTNKIDLAYLFYLPFCMVFTSFDRFHEKCLPLFLRNDQIFIWGADLKADLVKINCYYDGLPESEKEKGLSVFASRPPKDDGFLITRLWDRFLPGWRKSAEFIPPKDNEATKRIMGQIKEVANAKPLKPEQVDFDLSNPDSMIIKRRLSKRRGKWWQLPKDIEV